ncbi:hypothetical protein RRG08_039852 [Elysia crispata]|uniref:Uncharacterized protein n=1 Tax=Elysia crispata TaxID=231223 RepID=A0AAE0ZX58_9GAST|nr:hypothetical protein RRG08_039852 [Elysia crispata]
MEQNWSSTSYPFTACRRGSWSCSFHFIYRHSSLYFENIVAMNLRDGENTNRAPSVPSHHLQNLYHVIRRDLPNYLPGMHHSSFAPVWTAELSSLYLVPVKAVMFTLLPMFLEAIRTRTICNFCIAC